MGFAVISLEAAFTEMALALYRRWYALLPKSARRPLETARLALARRLATADPAAARAEMAAFVAEIEQTPGAVRAIAQDSPDALPTLKRLLERPGVLTADAPPRLAALLAVSDPALYAIGLMKYLPGRQPETLDAVRSRLAGGAERLPEAARRLAEEEFARFDEARADIMAGAASQPAAALALAAASEQTLAALEQQPDLVRVAWEQFLQGKAMAVQPTLGGPSFAGSKGVSPLPPLAALEAAAEPNAQGAQAAQRAAYFTDVRFPPKIKREDERALTVRLTVAAQPESAAAQQVELLFADPDRPEYVEVVAAAPGFGERFGAWSRTLAVYRGRDSDPAVFLLRAGTEVGKRRISVDIFHRGKRIGSVALECEIVAELSPGGMEARPAPEAAAVELFAAAPAPPADLELRVVQDSQANKLFFLLHSTRSRVGYHWHPVGEVQLTAQQPAAFLEKKFARLNRMARLGGGELTVEEEQELGRQIAAIGEELYEELFPAQLREEYWKRIRGLREQGVVRSVLVTSDEAWIPWELVKPYYHDEFSDAEQSDDFLAESFQLCRWLAGRGPNDRLEVAGAGLVAPEGELDSAAEEQLFAALRERGVTIAAPARTKAEVLALLGRSDTQLIHVVAHAAFKSEDPDESPLALEGAALTPGELTSDITGRLRKARPIIFLNACHSGRLAPKLTGLGGWAAKAVRQVQATAFVGALWEVNDELAGAFAVHFYERLLAGDRVGAAAQAARRHIRGLAPANSTWLAYAVYCDPNGEVRLAGGA